MADQRSAEAKAYRRLYGTVRWKRVREQQLTEQPLCERCIRTETVEPATVVHHKDGGHKGDLTKFWEGPFESLCKPHHDSDGALEDRGKVATTYGVDGYPIEP